MEAHCIGRSAFWGKGGCGVGGIIIYLYSLHIYLYIAELIALHEIKSAMDIAMH